MPELTPRNAQRSDDEPANRNQHNRAQVKEREAHCQAEARQRVEFLLGHEGSGFPAQTNRFAGGGKSFLHARVRIKLPNASNPLLTNRDTAFAPGFIEQTELARLTG
jgi:hypothetical protein